MLRRVSARELAEWDIFYRIEDEDREADEQAAAERRNHNWP